MSHIVGSEALAMIWKALGKPVGSSLPASAAKLLRQIGEHGWALRADIEDVIYDSDGRLHGLDVEALATSFGLPWRAVYPKPKARQDQVFGANCLAGADAAQFFITLEHLGFVLDVAPLIEVLFPAIRKKPNITDAEVSVLWYAKQRRKICIDIRAAKDTAGAPASERIETTAGYRAECHFKPSGEPVWMTVAGPRYRYRPSPFITAMMG